MKNVLENVAAVTSSNDTDVIGHLTWYSMSEMLITRDELRQKLIESGVGEGFMPHEIRMPDAFRRATSDKHRRKLSESVYENYLFREVASDRQSVQRNIVLETVDEKGKRLEYNPAAVTLVLDKSNTHVTINHTSELARRIAEEAVTRFHIYRDNYGSQTLRTVAMNVLKSMSPTPVRPNGGVYFVPDQFTPRLDALMSFMRCLDGGEGEKVPLINSRDMKGMITRKLFDHLTQTLKNCENGVHNHLPKGQVKEILEDARRVVQDFKEYSAILTGDLSDMEAYVDLIRAKMSVVLENMAV